MADPYVREVGSLDDGIAEPCLTVGVDHEAVTIGCGAVRWKLEPALQEEFARLFVAACWQAGHQHGRMFAQAGETDG